MGRIVIRIDNYGQKYTVSQMRMKLAQALAKLDGGQECTFNFTAALDNYSPAPVRAATPLSIIYGELARPENE